MRLLFLSFEVVNVNIILIILIVKCVQLNNIITLYKPKFKF